VDFEELLADSQAERRRREQRDVRRRTILQQRVQEVKQEMEELKREVKSCLTEVEACFNLLLPRFDLPDIYQSHDSEKGGSVVLGKGSLHRLGVGVGHSPVKKRRVTSSSCSSFVSLGSDSLGEEDEADEEVRKEPEVEEPAGTVVAKETRRREEERDLEKDGGLKEGPGADVAGGGSGGGSEAAAEEQLSPTPASSADSADSDSEVEWEEVPPDLGILEEDQLLPVAPAEEGGWQEHGLSMRGLVVPVTIGRVVEVEETEDNSSILASLRENRQILLSHFLPTLNKCLEVCVCVCVWVGEGAWFCG